MPPMFNKIVQYHIIGAIIRDGRSINIGAATQTTCFTRTNEHAKKVAISVRDSLEEHPDQPIPPGTTDVIARSE